jgi:hypothetical protein
MVQDTFVGTWKMNPARCEFDPNHKPTEATMTITAAADGSYELRAEGKNERGEVCAEKPQRYTPDGQPRPVDDMPGLTAVSRREWPDRIQTDVRREDGSLVGQAIMEISKDGHSLTATTSGFDSQLRQFRQFTVWERQ